MLATAAMDIRTVHQIHIMYLWSLFRVRKMLQYLKFISQNVKFMFRKVKVRWQLSEEM